MERQAPVITLENMARQLLSAIEAEFISRDQLNSAICRISSLLSDELDHNFTEKELFDVTANLFRFVQEVGQ